MSPESASVPTALHLNSLTRTGYSFVDWNTAANGSGVSYANGSTYPFGQSTKLYAQWKAGRAPARTVVFAANGGLGSMTPETANTPTALVSNRFTRNGYSFSGWNSSPAGSGTSYVAGAIYPFKVSVTLYAQWKKIPKPPTFTVTFLANGGTGAMRKERHRTPEALEHVAFKRIGFTFINWNTAPAGSGIAYPAGSIYSFVKSITLYAQWQRLKIVVPPAVDAELTVGPFTAKSSALTVAIEGEVGRLALEVKKDHDSKVALVGFGDRLSAANELNEALWAKNALLSQKRAQAVETYLRHSLAELGIVKIKITRSADTAKAGADGAKSEVGVVTAALT